ncbi:MAG: hypothetical protein ACKOQY_08025 [Bacteroidota bacterium]
MLLHLLHVVLCATAPDSTLSVVSDSSIRRTRLLHGDFSGSVITERSGSTAATGSLVLKSLAEFRRRTTVGSQQREWYAVTQLGYAALFDSVWIKQTDILRLQFRSVKRNAKWTRTWSVMAGTQWMELRRVPGREGYTGGFFNPLRVEAGSGIDLQFWEDSRLSVQPVTVSVQYMPKTLRRSGDSDKPFLETSRDVLMCRYGMGMQISIDEAYASGRLVWRNQTRVFVNALSSTQVHAELMNRIAFRFLKVMQLRIETQLNYAPEQSLRLEYRQEVLLGVFYEQRR